MVVIVVVEAGGSDVTPLLEQVFAAVKGDQAKMEAAFQAIRANNDRAAATLAANEPAKA